MISRRNYSESDIYLFDGYKIHPRQTKPIFKRDENDTRVTIRPTVDQLKNTILADIKVINSSI